KTTTIRSIMGLTPPRSGSIRFKGQEIAGRKSFQIAKAGIGFIPQGRHIFPSLSVQENLTMAARGGGSDDAWTLEEIYRQFPILKDRASLKGTSLSGGEQQMLAICRSLMTNPSLLLMDEPSEGLAPLIVRQVGEIIVRLKERGISILLVEQNYPLALRVADYVYIISKGRIVFEGTGEEMEADEETKVKYLSATG
ncbi:MAG: ABC transporter ATP-binding protein, partial [Deltaproteobacteria bacterium]|nr:ABC transporter ATP-binding protein [Deltaproteobacteria bacterium]